MKRAIHIICSTIFYISRAIKKSSKQRHIIVCFSVLSISFAFTIWTYFINEWIPRRNFKKRTISDTCINNGYKKIDKKKYAHTRRITFAWIWGLTGITFARRKSIAIARKMYMRFVLHLPCLHLRGLSVI
jgi:hypothetical protein